MSLLVRFVWFDIVKWVCWWLDWILTLIPLSIFCFSTVSQMKGWVCPYTHSEHTLPSSRLPPEIHDYVFIVGFGGLMCWALQAKPLTWLRVRTGAWSLISDIWWVDIKWLHNIIWDIYTCWCSVFLKQDFKYKEVIKSIVYAIYLFYFISSFTDVKRSESWWWRKRN